MKLYDVEDRAVAWINSKTAFLFTGSEWIIARVHLARKAMLDGHVAAKERYASADVRTSSSY